MRVTLSAVIALPCCSRLVAVDPAHLLDGLLRARPQEVQRHTTRSDGESLLASEVFAELTRPRQSSATETSQTRRAENQVRRLLTRPPASRVKRLCRTMLRHGPAEKAHLRVAESFLVGLVALTQVEQGQARLGGHDSRQVEAEHQTGRVCGKDWVVRREPPSEGAV